jgi:peptidoglycan/LPS O-acetylase OafA/YrhL
VQSTDDLRGVLKFSIGLLCAAAFVLILVILSGGEVDDTSGKAIGTAIALASLSLTALAGSHLSLRRPQLALFGYATVLISGLAFLLTAFAIWTEPENPKAVFYALILALACGHTSVLLASSDEGDSDGVRMVRYGTVAALWLLAVLAIAEISDHGNQVDPQGMGVVAVLYALGAIVLPLLRRAGSRPGAQGEVQVDHLVIAGSDPDRTARFYAEGLGIGAAVATGAEDKVCLVWPGTAESAVAHLLNRGIEVIGEPAVRSGAHGVGVSVHCRDPDGRLVELISYG